VATESALEAFVSITFVNWTSRVAIAGRVAESRRQSLNWYDSAIPGDYHLPFGKAEIQVDRVKSFWQL
jgi:hypothetical protein